MSPRIQSTCKKAFQGKALLDFIGESYFLRYYSSSPRNFMSLMLIWKRFKCCRCEKNPLPSVNCIIGEQKIYFVWGLLSVAKIFSFEIPFRQRIEKRVIEVQLRRMSRNQFARETPFFFLEQMDTGHYS